MPVLNRTPGTAGTQGTPGQVPGKRIAQRQLPRLRESPVRLMEPSGPEGSAGE